MKNCIQHILDQGFGLFSINDALSIQYCNDDMRLCITPIPGLNEEPIYMDIVSRTPSMIRDEILHHTNIILSMYRDCMFDDISRL